MLSPWSGLPDDFVLEEYLERYGDAIEAHPADYAGRWVEACHPLGNAAAAGYREVRMDLGCGKGAFTIESALLEPDVLFIGIDVDPVSVAFAARLALEDGVKNAVFVPGRDGDDTLLDVFAPGELSTIYLNFPTPHPKGRDAKLRLTHASRLMVYRQLLEDGGLLRMQTDNLPFYRYTLAQLTRTGYEVLVSTEDARVELPATPETGYERRAVAMGAKICAIVATPEKRGGADPVTETADVPELESLYDYLPDDLDGLTYVPPEMARGISAIRRTRESARRHR